MYQRLDKSLLKTKTMEFNQVVTPDLILVKLTDKGLTNEIMSEELEGVPDSDKMVFFMFDDVVKFKVAEDGKKYKIRYTLKQDQRITSDTVYTGDQINDTYFIKIPENLGGNATADLTNYLRQVTKDFVFAVVPSSIKISLIEVQ